MCRCDVPVEIRLSERDPLIIIETSYEIAHISWTHDKLWEEIIVFIEVSRTNYIEDDQFEELLKLDLVYVGTSLQSRSASFLQRYFQAEFDLAINSLEPAPIPQLPDALFQWIFDIIDFKFRNSQEAREQVRQHAQDMLDLQHEQQAGANPKRRKLSQEVAMSLSFSILFFSRLEIYTPFLFSRSRSPREGTYSQSSPSN